MPALETFHANILPADHVDEYGPYIGELIRLSHDETKNPGNGSTLALSLPREIGKRTIAFINHYSCNTTSYNCHTYTTVARGWLEAGTTDPNIVDYGGMDVLAADDFPLVGLDEVTSGEAYGLFPGDVVSYPIRLMHSFIAIQDGLHLAVRTNNEKLTIAETAAVLDACVSYLGGKAIQLCHIKSKPSVMGSNHWQTMAQQKYPYPQRLRQTLIAQGRLTENLPT